MRKDYAEGVVASFVLPVLLRRLHAFADKSGVRETRFLGLGLGSSPAAWSRGAVRN